MKKEKNKQESKKSTKGQLQMRVHVVTEMIFAGLRRFQIIQNITDKEKLNWDVSERQVDNYIKLAKENISKQVEKDSEKLFGDIYSKYNYLYQRLVNVKDYKSAANVLDKLSELTGLKIMKSVHEVKTEPITVVRNIITKKDRD